MLHTSVRDSCLESREFVSSQFRSNVWQRKRRHVTVPVSEPAVLVGRRRHAAHLPPSAEVPLEALSQRSEHRPNGRRPEHRRSERRRAPREVSHEVRRSGRQRHAVLRRKLGLPSPVSPSRGRHGAPPLGRAYPPPANPPRRSSQPPWLGLNVLPRGLSSRSHRPPIRPRPWCRSSSRSDSSSDAKGKTGRTVYRPKRLARGERCRDHPPARRVFLGIRGPGRNLRSGYVLPLE